MIRTGLKICDDEQQEECRNKFGDNLEWTCSRRKCGKTRASEFCAYTFKMFRLHRLRFAGFPFKPGTLTLQEWEDLGMLEEALGR